jgi:hypothetical protein
MWKPQRLTTLWAFTAFYRDSFTFCCYYYYYYSEHHRRFYELLLFFYLGPKFFPSRFETVSPRLPARYIGELFMFSVCYSSKNCPLAWRGSAAVVVCRDVKLFGTKIVSLSHI